MHAEVRLACELAASLTEPVAVYVFTSFIGRCPELMLGGAHGNNEAQVYAELCQAAEEMVALIHTDGHALPEPLGKKEFSGNFVMRVEPVLHRRLAAKALAVGESLNSFCVRALAKA